MKQKCRQKQPDGTTNRWDNEKQIRELGKLKYETPAILVEGMKMIPYLGKL